MSSHESPEPDVPTRPVFVGGMYRSGTWMITRIIEARTRVGFLNDESHFYRYFLPVRASIEPLDTDERRRRLAGLIIENKRFETLGVRPEEVIGRLVAMKVTSLEEAFAAVLSLSVQREGKTRWGDKSPLSETYWVEAGSYHQDAKFVYIVRDPRAVLASRRRIASPPGPLAVARAWCLSVNSWLRASVLLPNPCFAVRYEDFVASPETWTRHLLDFVGDEVTDAEAFVDLATSKAVPEVDRNVLAVDGSSVEKWRQELSERDVAIVQQICSDRMELLDYELLPAPAHQRWVAAAMDLRYPAPPFSEARVSAARSQVRNRT